MRRDDALAEQGFAILQALGLLPVGLQVRPSCPDCGAPFAGGIAALHRHCPVRSHSRARKAPMFDDDALADEITAYAEGEGAYADPLERQQEAEAALDVFLTCHTAQGDVLLAAASVPDDSSPPWLICPCCGRPWEAAPTLGRV